MLGRLRVRFVIVIASLLAVTACGGSSTSSSGASPGAGGAPTSLSVGAAGFTESNILANVYAGLLTKAGFAPKVTTVASTEIFQSSLERGEIAVVPEYVATYADLLNQQINGKDAPSVSSPDLDKSLAALQRLAGQRGLTVLQPTKAVDQNAFAVNRKFAEQHNLKTLSDLGRSGIPVTIAAGPECATRPFCAPGLQRTYGIKVKGIDKLGVDTIQTKRSVQSGKNQLALVLTTDGTLADFDLVVLEDDKKLQNADNVVPVAHAATAQKHPQLADALNRLVDVLATEDLAQLNKRVDAQREKAEDVARDYLRSKGLV